MFNTLKEIWQTIDEAEGKYLKGGLQFIALFGFVAILILPFIFTLPSNLGWIDYSNKGGVGDTINGIASPFIAILVAGLTFLAFYIQYKANIQQRLQFNTSLDRQNEERKEQEHIWRVERFENKFYELLQLHKSNVEEMHIENKIKGRECFIHMFYELKACYHIIAFYYYSISVENRNLQNLDLIDLMDFAYRVFFFGIGSKSEKHFITSLKSHELDLYNQVKPQLTKVQNKYYDYVILSSYSDNYPLKVLDKENNNEEITIELFHYPFRGHVNFLGHYYRHLYQTATLATTAEFIKYEEKYGYLKTLRAQLSNFEQLMLYYNAIAWFDDQWREIFTRFRLIKNLPISIADFYESPIDHFQKEISELQTKGISMFEALE